MSASHDPKRDLTHFLKLAAAQIRHRIREQSKNEGHAQRTARLRLLEELIKEQIPNEDTRSSAGPSR